MRSAAYLCWRKHLTHFGNPWLQVDQGDDESDELDPVQQPITMRMLLTHTSGISYSIIPFLSDGRPNPACEGYNDHVDKGKTLAEVVQGIARQPLVAQPGTQWNYSMGLEVVGRVCTSPLCRVVGNRVTHRTNTHGSFQVIEVLSGKPIDVYFSEHIFDPLGMKSTQFIQRAPPTLKARRLRVFGANQGALSKDRQQFYSDDFAGPKMIELPASAGGGQGSALLPGGGLLSTVGDWTKFVNALLEDGGGILRPESVALMTSAQLPPACKGGPAMHLINGKSEEDATYTMGLGGAVGGPGERQLFEWGGVTSTVMWVDRAAGFGVVCFTQLLTSMVYPIRSELKDIVYASTLFGESQTARDVSKHPNTENKL